MAKNTTPPANDPAALAFSAVEDALKDSVFSIDTPVPSERRPTENPRSERLRAADKIAAQAGSIANDDRYPTSKILYNLQSKSSSAPTWIALVLSTLWLIATGVSGYLRYQPQMQNLASFVGTLEFIGLLATMVLPIIGFFGIATLFRRAQDLRNAASSITQAAIRLAEPEVTAADKVASVGQAVRREVNALGDGLERALSRAGELEVMIHNEVTALERTYSDNESRMRSLIAELASQRESVLTNTDRVREAITESHTGLVFDLDMISQRIAGTIVDSGGNLTRALETAGNTLSTGFGDRTESFITLVDNRTSDFLSALDDSSGRLSLTFEDHTASMSRNFETRQLELSTTIDSRMTALTEALDGRAQTISEAISDRTTTLSNLLTDGGTALLDQLRDRGQEVGSALDLIGTRISSDITGRSAEAEILLKSLSRQLDESVSIQLNAMDSRLQSALIEINGALEDTSERARLTISSAGAESLSLFDGRLGEISEVLDSRLSNLDGVIGDKGDKLIEALNAHGANFSTRANVLEMALDEQSGRFTETVAQRTQEMGDALAVRAQQITDTIGGRSREIVDSLQGHTEIIAEALDGRTQHLNEILEAKSRDLSEAIALRSQEFETAIVGRTGELTGALDDQTQKLAATVGTRTAQLSDALSTRTQQLSETLTTHTTVLSNFIGQRTGELAATIDTQATSARDKIDASLRNVTDTMAERVDTMSSFVNTRVTEFNDILGAGIDRAVTRLSDAETGLSTRIESATLTVGDSARQAADLIESGVNSARKAITDMVDQRLGTLPEAITARADITADRLAALNASISASITQSMADLESGADRIEETIATRISVATATIAKDVTTSANHMDNAVRVALQQIQMAAASIDELVSVKAVNSAESISRRMGEINQAVNEQTNAFAALVSEKSDQLQIALLSHGNVLRDALGENAREAEAIMSVSTSRILSDVTAALSKLNDSNLLLQRVLDASTTNLAALESSVAQQTATYSSTVRDAIGQTEDAGHLVSQHVGALQATIRSMVQEFSGMLGKLDTETVGITNAAQTLTNTSDFALETLQERRSAMDALAGSFASRADDIDGRMRMFAQSIADTVNDTERRLIGARRAMDEALNATTHTVTDTLASTTATITDALYATTERVSNALTSTGSQVDNAMLRASDSAASAMHQTGSIVANAIADNTAQISSVLTETSSEVTARMGDFRDTADAEGQRANSALRAAQQTMVAEMQRAIEEATSRFNDTAKAMRDTAREVGSELEATRSELQRGVSELPEETRASAAAMRRVVAEQIEALSELNAIVRAQPATNDINDRRSSPPRPTPAPRQEAPVRVEPRPEPQPQRSVDTFRPEPIRQESPRLAQRQPAATAIVEPSDPENGGWLRDVLRNATAKQAGTQQAGLSGLTDEIARAIDDTALADAWARYQAGEANVFSRRIYTLTGQGTYDEVRKKLQREPEFARTAQAYMSEFEQLLKRAVSGPNAASETREYLLSDRGKVYTTLAHASGRLS